MTHGCLRITTPDDDRPVMLHTSHTGMDIPRWIKEVPAFCCRHRFGGMIRDGGFCPAGAKTLAGCLRLLRSTAATSGYNYPPWVAALVIACRPECLCPVIPGYETDLASWSGIDRPVVLTLVSEDEWIIKPPGGKKSTIAPTTMYASELNRLAKERRLNDERTQ